MESFLLVAGQVAVLFLLMSVGFACRKAKLLDDLSVRGLINLLFYVVNPCLIVDAFNRSFDVTMLGGLGVAFAFAVVTHLFLIALTRFMFSRCGQDTRIVLRISAVFSNAGFMGIPLEQALLGSEGVFYGVAYIVAFNLFMWSWGLGVCQEGRFAFSSRTFRNPGLVGIAIGIGVFLIPWKLPYVLSQAVATVAPLNTPIAMAVIGYYLAGAKFSAALRSPSAHLAVAVRLLLCPALAIAALWPLRASLDRTLMMAMVIPAAAPVAAMVSMFAAKYERDVEMSVSMVSGTTLLSMVTMPVMLSIAMELL
ncbi:MAG: AEC family transporter [Kiritimatiellae bacterium]|nr:AEC family transporter [Kiritimatiellia bacterium]